MTMVQKLPMQSVENDARRRAGVRRTAVVVGLCAFAVYVGFMILTYMAKHP
jgi:hypothetical protein